MYFYVFGLIANEATNTSKVVSYCMMFLIVSNKVY